MYICSISMLVLDEYKAKDSLTVNQYNLLVNIVKSRNNAIDSWYKSVISNDTRTAVWHIQDTLRKDVNLAPFHNVLKFTATYIQVNDMGEFCPHDSRRLYLENVGEFPIIEDDNSYDF